MKSLLPVLAVCFSEHKREPPPVLLLSLFLKFSRQQVFLAVFLFSPLPVCSFALLSPPALIALIVPALLFASSSVKFSRQQVFSAAFLFVPLPVCSFALLAPHALIALIVPALLFASSSAKFSRQQVFFSSVLVVAPSSFQPRASRTASTDCTYCSSPPVRKQFCEVLSPASFFQQCSCCCPFLFSASRFSHRKH